MSKRILLNLNDIPDDFKELSKYYKNLQNINNQILITKECCHFNNIINIYDDIIEILNTYVYWSMPNNKFFDIIINNRELIRKNYKHFINHINTFEIKKSLISLINKNISIIYKNILENNDTCLLEYLCQKNIINKNFYKYGIKKMELINVLKKYNLIIPYNLLFDEFLKSDNIDYLKYIIENYKDNHNDTLIKLLNFKNSDFGSIYMIDLKLNLDYELILTKASLYKRYNIILKILKDNLFKYNELFILKLCLDNCNSLEIIEFINDKLININNLLSVKTGTYILEYFFESVLNNNFKNFNINLINDDNLSLGKLLFLKLIKNNSNIICIEWLLNKNIEKTLDLLNYSVLYLDTDKFIWLYNIYNINYNENTMIEAIKSTNIKTIKFLQSIGCTLNVTYKDCDQFLNEYGYIDMNGVKILKYLTSKKLGFNIDNRYIIRSIIYNIYEYFEALYENYPEMQNFIFKDKNIKKAIILNNRLTNFIEKYEINVQII